MQETKDTVENPTPKLSEMISHVEGKKHQASHGDIKEIVSIMQDIFAEALSSKESAAENPQHKAMAEFMRGVCQRLGKKFDRKVAVDIEVLAVDEIKIDAKPVMLDPPILKAHLEGLKKKKPKEHPIRKKYHVSKGKKNAK